MRVSCLDFQKSCLTKCHGYLTLRLAPTHTPLQLSESLPRHVIWHSASPPTGGVQSRWRPRVMRDPRQAEQILRQMK